MTLRKSIVKQVQRQGVKALKKTARAVTSTGRQYISSTISNIKSGDPSKIITDIVDTALILGNPEATAALVAQNAAIPLAKAVGNRTIGRDRTEKISKRMGQARNIYSGYRIIDGLMTDPVTTVQEVYAYNKRNEATRNLIKNFNK